MGISTYHQDTSGDNSNQDYQHCHEQFLQRVEQMTTGKLMMINEKYLGQNSISYALDDNG